MRYGLARFARRWTGVSRSVHDKVLIGFVALLAVLVAIALTQSEWTMTLVALGFLSLTAGWVGMYFQVKKTDPDHPVANATYIGKGKTLTAFRLIGFHRQRHGMDPWIVLVALGVGLVVIALVRVSLTG